MKTRFILSDDRFRIEVGGQLGSTASFNDIASMFIGKEI